jgi:hypothetical protein
MIDDELHRQLLAHAKQLHKQGRYDKPNISAATRDLLRMAVGAAPKVLRKSASSR